jgi:hypothetical protein
MIADLGQSALEMKNKAYSTPDMKNKVHSALCESF